MAIPAKSGLSRGDVLESVLINGDLALLSEQERVNYYMRVCDSLGLNPLTRPFEYIKFQGKLILYARKDCTDQLRRLHNISLKLVSQSIANDVMMAHAAATLYEDGRERCDEDVGALACPANLKGEALANATMKTVTKAKRRVTLSICGLGMLDETEVAAEGSADRAPQTPAPNVLISPPPHPPTSPTAAGGHPETGATPAPPLSTPQGDGAGLSLEEMAREAAKRGEETFMAFYNNRSNEEKVRLVAIKPDLRLLMDAAEHGQS